MSSTRKRGDDSNASSGSGRSGTGTGTGRNTNKQGSLGGPLGKGFGGNIVPDNPSGFQPGWQTGYPGALWRALDAVNSGDPNISEALGQIINTFMSQGSTDTEYRAKIFDAIMQYMFNQDQREYDANVTKDAREYAWNQLQENRLYENPTNQLARLMGAGISRDAALQILSGAGASGSVGGVGSAGTGAAHTSGYSSLGPMQVPGTLATQQAGMVLNAMTQLVNTGMSAATAYYQAKMMSNASYMSDQQKQGYDDATYVANAFQDGIYSGNFSEFDDDAITDMNAMNAYLVEQAGNNNAAATELLGSPQYQRMRSTMWGRKYMNDYWRQRIDSGSAGTLMQQQIRQNEANIALGEITYDEVRQEIINSKAELENIIATNDFIKTNTDLLHAQANKVDKECEEISARIKLMEEQGKTEQAKRLNMQYQNKLMKAQRLRELANAQETQMNNLVTANFLDSEIEGKSGLDWMTDKALNDIFIDCKQLATLKDKKAWEAYANEVLSDAEKATAINLLLTQRQKAGMEWANDHPKLSRFTSALDYCGMTDFYLLILKSADTYSRFSPSYDGNGDGYKGTGN